MKCLGSRLLAGTALGTAVMLATAHAQAPNPIVTPQGGQVVGGAAGIAQTPGVTTITQSSERAAIDWQSFNIGAKASVTFRQPNSQAIVLNRVTAPDPSVIAGRITANGQVVLENRSGVVFARGAQVNAESLVVSASGISAKQFMAGHLRFGKAPRPGARIVNHGTITMKQAGLAAFVAPQVINKGVITARLGHVILAGASAFTLDLYGDRLISLDVTRAVRRVDLGGRIVTALVTNSGTIIADGGSITLTARQADGLIQTLLNAGGTLRADTAGAATGMVRLQAVGGDLEIAGSLLARGAAPGAAGGTITAQATGAVRVERTARIDASGMAGGGVIAIGTDRARAIAGMPDHAAPRAERVAVAKGAVIAADATARGAGGAITLLSHGRTDQNGTLSARGAGGDGGRIEISSDGVISLSGTETAISVGGHAGEVLLDPATLVIGALPKGGTASSSTVSGTTTTFGLSSTGTSYIDPASLNAITGTIVIQAASLISVAESPALNAGLVALSLNSGGAISVNAPIALSGSLALAADGAVTIDAALSAHSVSIVDTGVNAAGAVIGAMVNAGTLFAAVIDDGGLTELADGHIAAATVSGAVGGGVSLMAANTIGTLGAIAVNGGGLTLSGSIPLNVNGPATAQNIALIDPSGLTLAGMMSVSGGGTINLVADTVSDAGAVLSAPSGTVAVAPYDPGLVLDLGGTAAGALDVSGLLASAIAGSGAAAVNFGGVQAGAASFTAGSIAIEGDLPYFGSSLVLTATGGITDGSMISADRLTLGAVSFGGSGIVSAHVLAGNLSGAASFGNSSNNIGTLGNMAVGPQGLFLADGSALTLDGTVSASGSGTIGLHADALTADPGAALAAPGGAVTLTSNTPGLPIMLGGAGEGGLEISQALIGAIDSSANIIQIGDAATGLITAPGALTANSSNIRIEGADMSLASPLTFDTLDLISRGGISAAGVIAAGTLAASAPGTISLSGSNQIGVLGTITAGGDADVNDAASLLVAGTVSAANAVIAALGLSIPGSIAVLGSLTLDSTDGITGNGVITAPYFQGAAGGALALGGMNSIGTIGGLTAAGDLSLNDAAPLIIAGPVNAANAGFTAAGLNIPGTIATGGTLSLVSTGGIGETGGILAAMLAGSAGGDAAFIGANQIAVLGNFGGGGIVQFSDMTPVSVAGSVSGSGIDITAPSLTISGMIDTPGSFTVAASGFTASGIIDAAALSGLDVFGGDVSLTGANHIAALGPFDIGGNLLLNDGSALSVTGGVTAANAMLEMTGLTVPGSIGVAGTLALNSGGGISETGMIDAAVLTGRSSGAAAFTGGNLIGTLGGFSAGPAFTLGDNLALSLDGSLDAATVRLQANGIAIQAAVTAASSLMLGSTDGITETGGVDAGTLSSLGGIEGGASLTGVNNIRVIGNFTASGDVAVNDRAPLTVAGRFEAPSLMLAGPGLLISGQISTPSTLSVAENFIDETGSITADVLRSRAITGPASLNGVNHIGGIGQFLAPGQEVSLTDAGPLALTGPLVAQAVTITAAGQITLDGIAGGGLFIGGSMAPYDRFAGFIAPAPRAGVDSVLRVTGGGTSFIQSGVFYVNSGPVAAQSGYPAQANTLYLMAEPSGNLQFADLNAPATELAVEAGNGAIGGQVTLARLLVDGSPQGSASLYGTLGGVPGTAGAVYGAVFPFAQRSYQFDSCPLGSVNCTILQVEALPAINPLQTFNLSPPRRRRLDRDVHLPGIAEKDY